MHMHYAFETVFEFLHSFRFVIQKVCRICRSRRFVLESFPQGVIVVPIEVMAELILTVHGWKGKKGKKLSLFTFDSLVQALSTVRHWSDMVMSQVRCNSSSCACALIYRVNQWR